MKLAQDVQLHLLKTSQFKTNHITFRFSGELDSISNLSKFKNAPNGAGENLLKSLYNS